jgi:uncharacterized protein (UPF0332 family)
MKAETADYLTKARTTLAAAQKIVAIPLPDIAARETYLAVFHASEAYIFEHTGKAAKSHRGVIREFNRLARAEPRIGRDLVKFLGTLTSSSNAPIMALVPRPRRLPLRKRPQPLQPRSASSTPLRKACHPA